MEKTDWLYAAYGAIVLVAVLIVAGGIVRMGRKR